MDALATRESLMQLLHYVQSLRSVAERPPQQPTRNFRMVDSPRLCAADSDGDGDGGRDADGDALQQFSWSKRLPLGLPPVHLQMHFQQLSLALEGLWMCEKDAFETLERLAQTLMLKEHTWHRLMQLQQQVRPHISQHANTVPEACWRSAGGGDC
jgi:hypothetical protein